MKPALYIENGNQSVLTSAWTAVADHLNDKTVVHYFASEEGITAHMLTHTVDLPMDAFVKAVNDPRGQTVLDLSLKNIGCLQAAYGKKRPPQEYDYQPFS